jgi:hypothetical protein
MVGSIHGIFDRPDLENWFGKLVWKIGFSWDNVASSLRQGS